MKTIASIIGVVLIVGGGLIIYDGIQSKQTVSYKVKKELSTALKTLSKDSIRSKTKISDKSNLKLIGGGVAVVTGVILLFIGFKK
jgi:hypothetical protein